MILLYPLLVIAAGVIIWRERTAARNRGWTWFYVWSLAGAVFTFSLLAGFSIGLFFLPFAAVLLIWVARRAPGAEAIGFLEGIGVSLLLVALLNRDHTHSGGIDPWSSLIAGSIASMCAVLAYGVTRVAATRRRSA
jgi:hypothetical protein